MKRTMMLAAAMVVAVAALATAQAGFRADDVEEVELSGVLRLAEGERPVLVVGSREYVLALHPALTQDLDVSSGERVSLEGVMIERDSFDLISTITVVRVHAIEADGTRHVLATPRAGGFGPNGAGRPGMLGGRPGGAGQMGPGTGRGF